MNRRRGGATATEIAAAAVSVILVTVATFVRSAQMIAPTVGALIFMTLGFSSLAIWRELSAQRDPRAQTRLLMAAVAFVVAAAVFVFAPAIR